MNNESFTLTLNNLLQQIQNMVDDNRRSRDEILQQVCDLLASEVPEFDWVGFYMTDPEAERELVLGPFSGEPTEHTRIPFGKGICGQSADTHQTFVVQNVAEADNYLSCSVDVQAEIVVPVIKNDTYVAQIDVDSHTKNSITKEHREMLEKICDITAKLF